MARELIKSLGVTLGTVVAAVSIGNMTLPANQQVSEPGSMPIIILNDTNHDGAPDTATSIYPSFIYGTNFSTRQPTAEEVRTYQIRAGIPVLI